MKLCRDCRYATPRFYDTGFCNKPENIVASVIDGDAEYVRSCRSLRENKKLCGPDGAWFEPKAGA